MGSVTKLIIQGSSENVLDVQLSDILECIEGGSEFLWAILWITAVGKKDDIAVLDLENKVNKSVEVIIYDWQSLNDLLLGRFTQIMELLVCGDRNSANLRRYEVDQQMYLACKYVIELVDSSYWIICTNDEEVIQNLKSDLGAVVILDELQG